MANKENIVFGNGVEVKAADAKEAAKTAVKKAATKTETAKKAVKTAAVKAETKAEEAKETVKETVKEAAKTTTKKAAATKTAAKTAVKKTTAKAAKKEVKTETFIQYNDEQTDMDAVLKKVEADLKVQKVAAKDIKLYIKPQDGACYYVADGKVAGRVDLF